MPWIEATLRGQKVFARARDDGALVVEGGRVEIRYNAGDARAYRASVANLAGVPGAKVLADDTCVSAELVGGAKKEKSKAAFEPTASAADRWIAYTDGACSGNPGPAGAGLVVIVPGGKMHEGFEYLGESTNNVAELTAILRAVEAIPAGAKDIVVHTDSQYAIGVLSKGWKAKKNQELVATAKKLVATRRAKLVYVPGHAGVPLNERADELAREAIRTRRTQQVVVPGD